MDGLANSTSARALSGLDILPGTKNETHDCYFVVEELRSSQYAIHRATKKMAFMGDQYPHVDVQDFYRRSMNTTRAFDLAKALAKLFVLPLELLLLLGRYRFQTILVAAHQITDGLTMYRWNSHFTDLLNLDTAELEQQLTSLCSYSVARRLPPTQEDLYPPIDGNVAHQRWFWAVSRILRHTWRPPPPSFPNPLRRTTALAQATPMPATYSKILSYREVPPLDSFNQEASLSPISMNNLRVLCRTAGASIGSGCFTLVALAMMILEERLHPLVPLLNRHPFVGSFPVNPRPFLAGAPTTGVEDSLILAFSDGLTLPFLTSDLPTEGRFKLLARQADRQLRTFQKRKEVNKKRFIWGQEVHRS